MMSFSDTMMISQATQRERRRFKTYSSADRLCQVTCTFFNGGGMDERAFAGAVQEHCKAHLSLLPFLMVYRHWQV